MTAPSAPNRPPRGRHALIDAGLEQRRHDQRSAGSFVKTTHTSAGAARYSRRESEIPDEYKPHWAFMERKLI
jgi:hypothetical protein